MRGEQVDPALRAFAVFMEIERHFSSDDSRERVVIRVVARLFLTQRFERVRQPRLAFARVDFARERSFHVGRKSRCRARELQTAAPDSPGKLFS